MKDKIFIQNYQMMIMVCCMFSFSNMLSLPMAISEVSRQDAWLSFYLPVFYGFGLAFLLFVLMRRFPGHNLYEIAKLTCGKWIGGFLNAGLIVYLFMDLVINLRLYSDYINSSILLRTPKEFILLLTVSLLIYCGKGSIVYIARSAAMFFPIFMFLYVLHPFMLLNEIDLRHLLPALRNGSSPSLMGGVLGMGSFGDIIALGAFMHTVRNPRGLYVSLKCGVAISAFVLTIWLLLILTTLSHTLASKYIYVGWILVQLIHITDFLDRVDLFIISLWLPNLMIKYCILYLAILIGLSSFTKSKNHQPYNVLMGLIVTLTTVVSFSNVGQVVKIYDYGMLPFTLLVQIVFFGAVFIALFIKRKATTAPIPDQWKFGRVVWVPLAGCGLALGLSDLLSNSIGIYGKYCEALYFVCLLAVLLLSLWEFKKLPSHN